MAMRPENDAAREAVPARSGRSDGNSRPAPAAERAADARLALLRFYYLAAPLFFLADTLWGVSVRASFLPRKLGPNAGRNWL
jgi:hypothetical protein